MSEEALQAEGLEPEVTTEQVTTEEAQVMGDNPEKSQEVEAFSEGQQAVFDKAIGKTVAQMRQMERERDQLQQQLQQFQTQQPAEQRPVVGEPPDQFDDDYDQKLQLYRQQVEAAAQFDYRQTQKQQDAIKAQQEAQQKQIQELQTVGDTYKDRAKQLGVDPKELAESGQVVGSYGFHPAIQQMMLTDEKGPLITNYLGQNPQEIEAMRGMNVTQMAIHIEQNVKPKADKARPKVTQAPAPTGTISGSGVPPKKPGPAGATFL